MNRWKDWLIEEWIESDLIFPCILSRDGHANAGNPEWCWYMLIFARICANMRWCATMPIANFTLLLELLVSLSFTISPLNLWSVMCCISDFRFGRETFRWPDQHVRWQQQGPTPPFKKEIFCQIWSITVWPCSICSRWLPLYQASTLPPLSPSSTVCQDFHSLEMEPIESVKSSIYF